jgi:hypothetical protein
LHQANNILPTIPVPSLINHINVAAKGVEELLPTPTPSSTALVDKDPDKLLANAFIINKKIHLKIS